MGLQYSIKAIGSIILQSAVNSLGSLAVAAMTAGGKISMFFCCPYDAMGSTMATYGGQNMGAGKMDRIHAGLKAVSILGVVYSIAACCILFFTGEFLTMLFVGSGAIEVIAMTKRMMLISSLFYIPLAFVTIVRFLIQGMGYSQLADLAGVCAMVGRAVVGFACVPVYGFTAACYASPIAWILADLFLFPAYFRIMRRMTKVVDE